MPASHRTFAAALGFLLAMAGAAATAQVAGPPDTGEPGFATRSVTGLGLTGEPNRNGTDNGAGGAVGSGANAGGVGIGSGGGAVGTGTGPGTPQPGGGSFDTPSRN